MNPISAAWIRAQITLMLAGDLRGVPVALSTTDARTEAARADLRRAIVSRELAYPVLPRAGDPAVCIRTRSTRSRYYAPTHPRESIASLPEGPLPLRLALYRARMADQRAAAELAQVCDLIMPCYARCGYRVSQSSWAGGNHTTTIALGAPNAVGTTSRAWSKNKKWSGLDSHHAITVPAEWPSLPASARVVDRLLTLEMGGLPVEPGIYRATWCEQGRGTTLSVRHGYLVDRRPAGPASWVHADTLRGARKALRAPVAPQPIVDLASLDAAGLLRRARCAPSALITLEDAPIEGRVCAAGVRDWMMRRPALEHRSRATALEIAELAVASQDRLAHVLLVLRAAGARHRESQRVAA